MKFNTKLITGGEKLHKKNTHFAIHKETNSIVYTWDYRGYDKDELKEFKADYFFIDMMDVLDGNIDKFKKSDYLIVTKKGLVNRGIDLNNYLLFQGQKY